ISMESSNELLSILKKHAVLGTSIAFTNANGDICTVSAGKANPIKYVDNCTNFRTASISKFIVALVIMNLHKQNVLNIEDDISKYFSLLIKNPNDSKVIKIKNLMSHTSTIIDSELYFNAFNSPKKINEVINFSNNKVGNSFEYSNFAAGMLEYIIEKATGLSLQKNINIYVAKPLDINIYLFPNLELDIAEIYRVFPKSKRPNYKFDLDTYQSNLDYKNRGIEYHYIRSAGGMHISAIDLLTLTKAVLQGDSIINKDMLELMESPVAKYPMPQRKLYHGLGTLIIDDKRISKNILYGHQGFAYGAVQGMFYDRQNNMCFVSLNNGAKEWRNGHFSKLNEALLNWWQKYYY
ncbi:MAG: beta-lactamase family protein, partial [Christensenellaceae bacterium]|nr:beta-lactamase family protein [Christensenellaceae bacterium]